LSTRNLKYQKIKYDLFNNKNKSLQTIIENEKIIEVIEGNEEISVTIVIPDIRKEDINLWLTKKYLEITIDNNGLTYHKLLNLQCGFDIETAEATYIYGVLDIIIKKE
jgi:HSP20 family molecular chaperone IbpA